MTKNNIKNNTANATTIVKKFTVVKNQEKQGIELYFPEKPSDKVRDTLKCYGFKWHNTKLCWYAKEDARTLAIATKLAELYKSAPVKKEQTVVPEEAPKAAKKTTKKNTKSSDVKLGSGDVYMTEDQKIYIMLDGKRFELKSC